MICQEVICGKGLGLGMLTLKWWQVCFAFTLHHVFHFSWIHLQYRKFEQCFSPQCHLCVYKNHLSCTVCRWFCVYVCRIGATYCSAVRSPYSRAVQVR